MAPLKETWDKWFDNNVDLTNRTIYIGSINKNDGLESGVDAFMAESTIKAMHVLENKNSESITILMNNPGGDWYHGMAVYDVIKQAKSHCTIKVFGYAMSMGSIILQAADKRVMMPHSKFMIHFGSTSVDNHMKTVERVVEEEKRLNYIMENIYLDVMLEKEEKKGHGYLAKTLGEVMTRQYALGYPPPTQPTTYTLSKKPETKREELRKILREMLSFDTFLTAEEAVDLGFADEVYSNS